ncbi:MAG: DNA-processing protein DprA [Defluviitaleaceae bacterium]|nr:DNA-processing protein DprA [Defluviitaleaceae bacterium]
MREKLIALSMVKKGNWNEVYQFLQRDRQLSTISDVAACQLVERLNYKVITVMDDDYPISWREMSKPPFVVYLKGNRDLLTSPVVGIVGGKEMSGYTKKAIERLMMQLPKEISVVTGFERGVEVYVNECRKNRIVCLASGFEADELYGKQKTYEQLTLDDLVISERPPGEMFDLQAYYRAYHLAVELSQVICVFELASFDLRVKYLNYLTEIGKPTVVLPDRKGRQTAGGLGLLNRGATCLMQASDVLALLK